MPDKAWAKGAHGHVLEGTRLSGEKLARDSCDEEETAQFWVGVFTAPITGGDLAKCIWSLRIYLPSDLAVPLLGIHQGEMVASV